MAPAALPLAKLGGLLIKTLSKPFAKQIKHQMVKYESTRNTLVYVGQSAHALTTRMTIWSSGYKVRSINSLEETEALTRGADILSESIIFFVSGSILVYEYHRSSEKERKKEEERLQKIRDDASLLQAKLISLDKRLGALEVYAKTNRKSILGLGAGAEYVEPTSVIPIHDTKGFDVSEVLKLADQEKEKKPADYDQTNIDTNVVPNSTANTNPSRSRSWYWPFG